MMGSSSLLQFTMSVYWLTKALNAVRHGQFRAFLLPVWSVRDRVLESGAESRHGSCSGAVGW